MARLKLLFVTDIVPAPIDCGQRVRLRGLTSACRKVADVTLIAPRPQDEADVQGIEQDFEQVFWIDDAGPSGLRNRMSCALKTAIAAGGIPSWSKILRYMPYVDACARANPAQFDLIWAERPHIARLCAAHPEKTVIDLDDLEHLKIRGQMKLARGFWLRLKLAYRYAFYRWIEVVWTRKHLATVVCSPEDKDYLLANHCKNAIIVPNGAALPLGPRPEARPGGDMRLLFLANLAYEPNADALRFLQGEILPELLRVAPEAKVDVVGRFGLTEPVASPALRFRGFVDDLAEALSEYDMLIAPLRYGGGTKLKVIDAMARGLPVLTTAVGAEGLGLTHRVSVWLAETPAQFVEGALRLKSDPEFAARMAAKAQDVFAERFDWPSIERRLAKFLFAATDYKLRGSPTEARRSAEAEAFSGIGKDTRKNPGLGEPSREPIAGSMLPAALLNRPPYFAAAVGSATGLSESVRR